MNDFFPFIINQVIPGLNTGFFVSIKLIVPSALFGFLIGVVTGTLRVYGPGPVKKLCNFYVAVFRGTPLVVQLYFWYFALPYTNFLGVRIVMSAMTCAIVGFSLCSGAYHSEYIRGGLLSIKTGQLKAAQALGMTPFTSVKSIVLPQAFRHCFTGCCNEVIYLIKYSSLASIITINEITGIGRGIAKASFRNVETFLVVGIYYLILVTLASAILNYVERRMEIPGFDRLAR
ncbi:amino acid ABC transporter permease [Desulfobacter curvatus]|uniref:amino acid ABC transporter permease n=1 Tax=Desulfobacter curvatus TaxID=2290 RepID=UPI000381ACA1|nr:amino acid ABC transporter permease [Desulfobacter curvatus]